MLTLHHFLRNRKLCLAVPYLWYLHSSEHPDYLADFSTHCALWQGPASGPGALNKAEAGHFHYACVQAFMCVYPPI